MKQSILPFVFSLLLVTTVVSTGWSQQTTQPVAVDPAADTVTVERPKKPDSLKEKFSFRAIRIGTDVIAIGKTIVSSNYVPHSYYGYELNGDIDLGKFYLAVDAGTAARSYYLRYGDYGFYKNDGSYFRIGLDINLLKKDPDRNMFFFGFRYGMSSFSESARLYVKDAYFGSIIRDFSNSAVTARWGELTTGLRIKVWKELWMGYTARMKFLPATNGDNDMKAFEIPGYGFNRTGFYWGFNYQLFWRFPVAKQKKPAK